MRLRGITIEGKPYYFGIEDGPVSINDRLTILINRENSPMIISKSIVRGTDDLKIFETDFVSRFEDLKFLGFVVYVDGFYIYSLKTKELTPIRSLDDLVITENTRMSCIDDLSDIRSFMRFSHKGQLFGLNRIMYSKDEELFTSVKLNREPVIIRDVKWCTGLAKGCRELSYGQNVKDGKIVFHDYRPMVLTNDNIYREVEDKDYV